MWSPVASTSCQNHNITIAPGNLRKHVMLLFVEANNIPCNLANIWWHQFFLIQTTFLFTLFLGYIQYTQWRIPGPEVMLIYVTHALSGSPKMQCYRQPGKKPSKIPSQEPFLTELTLLPRRKTISSPTIPKWSKLLSRAAYPSSRHRVLRVTCVFGEWCPQGEYQQKRGTKTQTEKQKNREMVNPCKHKTS